jgi:hypothetical protein
MTTVGGAARRDDRASALPPRCVEIARESPSASPSRRKTAANDRAVNRAAVRRYRERKRTDEKERIEECQRLREENETLRLALETSRAELKHSRWLLRVVAWKYDLDLADIPTEKPSTSPPGRVRGSDASAVFPAGGVPARNDIARPFAARGGAETRPRKIPRASDDDSKPAGAPDELELKDFLEEYFTHGDACPCYESTDADARAAPTRGTRGSRYDDTFTSHGETFYTSSTIL